MSVLNEILDSVRADLAARQIHTPLERLKEMANGAASSPRDVMTVLKGDHGHVPALEHSHDVPG